MTAKLLVERRSSEPFLGLPTVSTTQSATEPMSQTKASFDICQVLEDNSTDWHWQWLDDVGVPVLIRGTEFVAYDNEKSATIKATWSSHNNLAGLAIYGLPYDNPEGECPDRPFPILQSIVDAQVCSLCATDDDSKCSPSFHTSCNYRLPEYEEANIPFERCTEIVVEHAIIDTNATIHFPSKEQKETAEELVSFS
ncbi:unnamed protein product [Strongylus vulgaris]|uniref:GH18 domain-containing protein n=1 Tax=Strongylus vulgaris TaxID=40348 RepID=A0A3P7JQQ8_STRVU|nr:unnamed protein product [Strongylus vulgaris]